MRRSAHKNVLEHGSIPHKKAVLAIDIREDLW